MSTILVTVSKRPIEDTKYRAREAADRGPAGGIIDGPRRISEVQRFLANQKRIGKHAAVARKSSTSHPNPFATISH